VKPEMNEVGLQSINWLKHNEQRPLRACKLR
jgi:hypothetical protein